MGTISARLSYLQWYVLERVAFVMCCVLIRLRSATLLYFTGQNLFGDRLFAGVSDKGPRKQLGTSVNTIPIVNSYNS